MAEEDSGAGGPSPRTDTPRAHEKLRRRLVLLLVILASIAAVTAGVATWLHQTLLDTDSYMKTVAPIGKQPEVKQAAADYVSSQIITHLDLETRTREVLPAKAQFLAAPVAGTVDDYITKETTDFFNSETAYNLWLEVNRRAHSEVVALLRGKSKYLEIQGDQVQLDLLPLIAEVLKAVDQRLPDVLGKNFVPPEISADTPPDQARQEISTALGGLQLPEDFGVVTLFQADSVRGLQQGVRLFDRVVVVLWVITAGLVAASIFFSLNRRRTLLQLGAGAVLAVIVVRVLTEQLNSMIVDSLKPSPGGELARASISSVVHNLDSFTLPLLVAGVIVCAAAYFAGKPAWALTAAGATVNVTKASVERVKARWPSSAWAATNSDGLRLAGVVVAVLALLVWLSSGWGALTVIVLFALYQLLVSWLSLGWPFGHAAAQSAE